MIGVDTSFLVCRVVREHPVPGACWDLFQSEILARRGSMALAPQVLSDFRTFEVFEVIPFEPA